MDAAGVQLANELLHDNHKTWVKKLEKGIREMQKAGDNPDKSRRRPSTQVEVGMLLHQDLSRLNKTLEGILDIIRADVSSFLFPFVSVANCICRRVWHPLILTLLRKRMRKWPMRRRRRKKRKKARKKVKKVRAMLKPRLKYCFCLASSLLSGISAAATVRCLFLFFF